MPSQRSRQAYKFLLQKENFIFYTLLLVCFSVRVQNFASASIWADESFTLDLANRTLGESLDVSLKDVNPPLYGFIMHYWGILFGYGLPQIRFFSVLCSVGTMIVLFKTGRRFFNLITAIAVSLFYSFSFLHIFYSEEARCYAFLCLLTSLSVYYLLGFIRGKKTAPLIALSGVNLLMLYTHYLSAFLFIAEALIVVVLFRRQLKLVFNYSICQLIAVALFFPWFNVSYLQGGHGSGSTWIPELTWDLFYQFYVDMLNNDLSVKAFAILSAMGFGLAVYFLLRAKSKLRNYVVLLVLSAVPMLAVCFVSLNYVHIFLTRYEMFCTIPMYLFFGFLISSVRWHFMLRIVITLLLFGCMLPKLRILTGSKYADWRQACAAGDVFLGDETSVVIMPAFVRLCYDYYNLAWYYNTDYKNLEKAEENSNIFPISDTNMLHSIEGRLKKRVLYYSTHWWQIGDDKGVEKVLQRNYHQVFAREYWAIRFYVYEKN